MKIIKIAESKSKETNKAFGEENKNKTENKKKIKWNTDFTELMLKVVKVIDAEVKI